MATAKSKVDGNRKKTGGRKAGTPNKTTALLKEAILQAAEKQGLDGEGADGVTGYCQYLAAAEQKAFAQLLGKVLPMQIQGDKDNPVITEIVTRIVRPDARS